MSVTLQAAANRPVWLSILGLSWFWAIGATLLSEFPSITRDVLGAEGQVVTLLLTMFAVGIGLGSMLCARLLHGEVSARHVPFAAFGITLFTWDFGSTAIGAGNLSLATVGAMLHSPTGWHMLADLLLLAACGGLYSVPLYAILQEQSEPSRRARTIAANNIVNAVMMVLGAGFVAACSATGLSAPAVLQIAAVANFAVALWIVRLLPQTFFRTLFRWYFRLFHETRVEGLENVAAGRRAVDPGHQPLSFLDGCLVAAFLPGDLVFAIDTDQARRFWFLKYVHRYFSGRPEQPDGHPSDGEGGAEGRRLAIFPEGRITLTGALMKIYDGPGMVADRAGAAIVPVRIDGLAVPQDLADAGQAAAALVPDLSLTVLPPVRLDVPAALVGRDPPRGAGPDHAGHHDQCRFPAGTPAAQPVRRSAGCAAVDTTKGLPVMADIVPNETGRYHHHRTDLPPADLGEHRAWPEAGGVHPRRRARRRDAAERGRRGGDVFALQSQARVPAMMNFTSWRGGMLSCCAAAGIETILTSRRAVQKGKLDRLVEACRDRVRFIYLEDVRASIGLMDKLLGMLTARRARRLPGADLDAAAPALVLFTSGSEGAPKGVVHSHRSLLANCAQLRAVVDFNPTDRVFNALPMFHSFGMTATLLPLMYGVRTFLYPSPLHYKLVPEMVYAEQSTIMFGTDTFLTGYARKGHALDFQSLRYIFAGAEKVRPETRAAYMAAFQEADVRRLWRDRDRAGAGAEHLGACAGRFCRPPAARHRGAAGTCAGHRRRRPTSGARSERDAGLSPGGGTRGAGASAGRLVRHRRHRYDR